MGYILIVIGIVAIVAGIIMVTHKTVDQEETIANLPVDTSTEYPTQPAKTDTVIIKVENTVLVEKEAQPAAAVPAIEAERTSDEINKEKGNAFEDFVVNLLADHRFTLLERTQDAVSSAGVYAQSCKNPDLHVQQKRG